jgi:hypothetical protein
MQHGFSSMVKHHSIFIIKPNSSSYKYHGITLIRFVQHVTITASMQDWISGKNIQGFKEAAHMYSFSNSNIHPHEQ